MGFNRLGKQLGLWISLAAVVLFAIFVGWSPLLGLHLLIVVALSMLLRANKFAALVSVWVSNVFTFAFIYYPAYLVGRVVCGIFPHHSNMDREQIAGAFNKLFSPGNILTGFYTKEYWKQLWILLKKIGPELWVGCFLLGGLVAVTAYILCYNIIKSHRAKNPHRRYRNHL